MHWFLCTKTRCDTKTTLDNFPGNLTSFTLWFSSCLLENQLQKNKQQWRSQKRRLLFFSSTSNATLWCQYWEMKSNSLSIILCTNCLKTLWIDLPLFSEDLRTDMREDITWNSKILVAPQYWQTGRKKPVGKVDIKRGFPLQQYLHEVTTKNKNTKIGTLLYLT